MKRYGLFFVILFLARMYVYSSVSTTLIPPSPPKPVPVTAPEKQNEQVRIVDSQSPDIYHLNSTPPPNIKLRIGNPTSEGLLVVVLSQADPSKIKSVQYAPPKLSVPHNVSTYFSNMVEQYVVPTDLVAIALVPPALPALTADANAITRENEQVKRIKGLAESYLRQGRMTIWRISRINAGISKVYVNVQIQGGQLRSVGDKVAQVVGGIPRLVPNRPVQSGFLPEIDFAEWKQPAAFNYGANRIILKPFYLCERFGTCQLSLTK